MSDQALREHLAWMLSGENAHLTFERAIAGLPQKLRGATPQGTPHSPWRLLEHLRIAQWDILEFSRSADHVSPDFPDGYWPEGEAPSDEAAWDHSVAAFRSDLKAFQDLVADRANDLFTPFPWGDGQNLLREALLIADHNAYHLGQLVMVRRVLGAWDEDG